jgi:hypothetical protein
MFNFFQKNKLVNVERVGVILSFICAIHCMATPIFLIFAPMFLTSFAFSGLMEWALVSSSFLLATYLLFNDYRKHHKILPLLLIALALVFKIIEVLLHKSAWNWIFGLLLGSSIVVAYWINFRHKVNCTCKIKT